MIDINLLRDNPDYVQEALQKKGCTIDVNELLRLDKERRGYILAVEQMKAERNKLSSSVPALKKEGKPVDDVIARTRALGEEIKLTEAKLNQSTADFNDLFHALPNLADDDIVAGGKENNQPIYTFGTQPKFDFEPKDHVELCTSLGMIDYERGTRLSGNGFWIYRGMGARLEWALLNFFVSEHLKDGFEFILPPEMLNEECGFGCGQFPKFADEVYYVHKAGADEDVQQFLLPTAESALVNMYAGEIIPLDELPKKFFAYSPCFRCEAGSHRAEERGMVRGHQFNKVEMVAYTTPDQSDAMFELLLKKAQSLVEKLGLHYQTSKLAAEDISATMARTYDIEVWIPSMQIYKECSSVSNGRAYQARRSNTRYRTSDGKTDFVHLLNGSGLATSRLIPAIVEQFQTADGCVVVPEVLRPFMGGVELITPTKK